jgi:hypothetical protein
MHKDESAWIPVAEILDGEGEAVATKLAQEG